MRTALVVLTLLFGAFNNGAASQTDSLPVEEISPTTHCKEKATGKPRLKSATTAIDSSRDSNSDLKLRTEEAGVQENRTGACRTRQMSRP